MSFFLTSFMHRNFIQIFLTALILLSCAGPKGKHVVPVEIPVKVIEVSGVSGVDTKTYVGLVEPSKDVILKTIHSGTLKMLNLHQGDFVKGGDVVAVVESQTVKSMAESAEATLERAEDGYKRALQVYESGSMSEMKMVEVETQVRQARATAESARKALDECMVRAPFDGTICEIMVNQGEELTMGQPVVRLFDLSSVEIEITVPENEIGKIEKGDSACFSIPAINGSKEEVYIPAVVISKGISGSRVSHGYTCSLRPTMTVSGLMPGMVAKVRIDGMKLHGTVIPANVVRIDQQGSYVWAVDGQLNVVKQRVTVSGFLGDGVVVTNGLKEGDRVVIEGMQKICTGMKVRIVD